MAEQNSQSTAFPKLTDSQIIAIDNLATLKSFQDGERLFEAGESDFKFFVIKKGQVEIVERSTGKRKTVTVHEEKEFTGDVDMLTGKPSLVTAKSMKSQLVNLEEFLKKSLN